MPNISQRTESLLRAVRVSTRLDLKPETTDLIEQLLYDSLGLIATTCQTRNHEETLRSLIENSEPWTKVKPVLLDWWKTSPHIILAAKFTELAYLNASESEVCSVIRLVGSDSVSFWKEVHPAIRTQIIKSDSYRNELSEIPEYLLTNIDAFWLLPVERLIALSEAIRNKKQDKVFEIYGKYRAVIDDVTSKIGSEVAISQGRIKLGYSKAAIYLGYKNEALKELKEIHPGDREYVSASKLLASLSAGSKHFLESEVALHLFSLKNWPEKESALAGYMDRYDVADEMTHDVVPVVNALLGEGRLMDMQDPTSVNMYGRFCANNLTKVDVFPNISLVFKQNILRFRNPTLDFALWQNFLDIDTVQSKAEDEKKRQIYGNWLAVALFHRFVTGGSKFENDLHRAVQLFKNGCVIAGYPPSITFDLLKQAGLAFIKSDTRFSQKEKSLIITQLHLSDGDQKIRLRACEDYILNSPTPRFEILERILEVATDKKVTSLILSTIDCIAKHFSIRNKDLTCLWSVACHYKQFDLAWRIATVLNARQALNERIFYSWSVSGENRSTYSVQAIGRDASELVSKQFSDDHARIFNALLRVGHKIPSLAVSILGGKITAAKTPGKDSLEGRIVEEVLLLGELNLPSKLVSNALNTLLGARVPAFSNTVPVGRWSVFVSLLCDVMGYNAIDGDFKKLARIVEVTSNLVSRRASKAVDYAHALKWYKSLDHDEKILWLDMSSIVRKINLHDLEQPFIVYILTLAILAVPSHHDALRTIQHMELPIAVLRSLERFVVSDDYTAYRAKQGLAITVPVPSTIDRNERNHRN